MSLMLIMINNVYWYFVRLRNKLQIEWCMYGWTSKWMELYCTAFYHPVWNSLFNRNSTNFGQVTPKKKYLGNILQAFEVMCWRIWRIPIVETLESLILLQITVKTTKSIEYTNKPWLLSWHGTRLTVLLTVFR